MSRELVAQHQLYMRGEIGPSWTDRAPRHADGSPTEAFGAPLSAALSAEISTLDLARMTVDADTITVVSTKPSSESARLRAHLTDARWLELPESTVWNSDAALNAMIVPMEIVRRSSTN